MFLDGQDRCPYTKQKFPLFFCTTIRIRYANASYMFHHHQYLIPTRIIDFRCKLVACGAEAVNEWHDLGTDAKNFNLIENFKMHLHKLDVIHENRLPVERMRLLHKLTFLKQMPTFPNSDIQLFQRVLLSKRSTKTLLLTYSVRLVDISRTALDQMSGPSLGPTPKSSSPIQMGGELVNKRLFGVQLLPPDSSRRMESTPDCSSSRKGRLPPLLI